MRWGVKENEVLIFLCMLLVRSYFDTQDEEEVLGERMSATREWEGERKTLSESMDMMTITHASYIA